jgi:hypothetical protein
MAKQTLQPLTRRIFVPRLLNPSGLSGEIGKSNQFTLANGLKVIAVETIRSSGFYQLSIDRDEMLKRKQARKHHRQPAGYGTATKTKAEIDEEVL